MAECMLMQGGGGIKSDDVTAVASDVRLGKTYLGSDSDDDIKTGTAYMIDNLYNQSVTVDRYHQDHTGFGVNFSFPHGVVGVVSVTFQYISGNVTFYTPGAYSISGNTVYVRSLAKSFDDDGHVKVTVTAKGY